MHMYTRGYILEQQSILLLFVTRIFSTSMFLSALSTAIFNTRPIHFSRTYENGAGARALQTGRQ